MKKDFADDMWSNADDGSDVIVAGMHPIGKFHDAESWSIPVEVNVLLN